MEELKTVLAFLFQSISAKDQEIARLRQELEVSKKGQKSEKIKE